MPKRNHSRRTRLQRQLDPLLKPFVNTWLGRSWLIVGKNIDQTAELVKASFNNDLLSLLNFIEKATDSCVTRDVLVVRQNKESSDLMLQPYWILRSLRDDVATLMQYPALVGDMDEAVEWARAFAPRLKRDGDGRHSPEYRMRISFKEVRTLREAGVPIEYARAFDGEGRYPMEAAMDAYTSGIAPELALAFLRE